MTEEDDAAAIEEFAKMLGVSAEELRRVFDCRERVIIMPPKHGRRRLLELLERWRKAKGGRRASR